MIQGVDVVKKRSYKQKMVIYLDKSSFEVYAHHIFYCLQAFKRKSRYSVKVTLLRGFAPDMDVKI